MGMNHGLRSVLAAFRFPEERRDIEAEGPYYSVLANCILGGREYQITAKVGVEDNYFLLLVGLPRKIPADRRHAAAEACLRASTDMPAGALQIVMEDGRFFFATGTPYRQGKLEPKGVQLLFIFSVLVLQHYSSMLGAVILRGQSADRAHAGCAVDNQLIWQAAEEVLDALRPVLEDHGLDGEAAKQSLDALVQQRLGILKSLTKARSEGAGS